MNRSVAWHSPALGMVPARGSVTVAFQLPIDLEKERPIVLTATGRSTLIIQETTTKSVILENPTGKVVPYMLIIIPTSIVNAAATDWRQVLRALSLKFGKNKES